MKWLRPSLLVTTFLFAATPVPAQDDSAAELQRRVTQTAAEQRAKTDEAAAAAKSAVAKAGASASGRQLITLKFEGGTINDYVRMLRSVSNSNVLVAPEVMNVKVPSMDLRDVEEHAAIGVLEGLRATGEYEGQLVNVGREGSDEGGARAIYRISFSMHGPTPMPQRVQQTAVENVSDLLAVGTKPQDLLQAIETAVSMIQRRQDQSAIDIKFHEATGLVIARGAAEAIDALHMVVESLRASPASTKRREEEAVKRAKADMQAQLNRTQAELQDQLARANEARGQVEAELQAISRGRTEAMVQLDSVMAEIKRLRDQLEMAEDRRQQAEAHVADLQVKLQTMEASNVALQAELQQARGKK